MNTAEIQQRCIELIADAKKIPPETILPTTTFEELGLDSLDRVTLAFEVEEAYNVSIPESALTTIHSVDDMASGIQKALEMKSASAAVQVRGA